MKNLTSGNIRSQLMFLALPLIAGNMLQQFYHTIDALVIGRFAGPAAFAAIGVSGTVMNLFIFVINGFCTGHDHSSRRSFTAAATRGVLQ